MELFLDSVDFEEIDEAIRLGILTGVTTTPTFMYRQGIKDIDKAVVALSERVKSIHIEALGNNVDEILEGVERIKKLSLKNEPVFKIPVSNHGVSACRKLTEKGDKVNMHLVYTLNQAYLAMEAGATYVCPLVGRLQDQGYDGFTLVEQMVQSIHRYNYPTKVMVSSVRYPEQVRQALLYGAHACTAPWHVLKILCQNNLTTIGTEQFLEHARLMTGKVREVIREINPVSRLSDSILDALIQMTESRLGAVSIVDDNNELVGIFTDGDLRRNLKRYGQDLLKKKMSDFPYNKPVTIRADALLYEAVEVFGKHEFDNIIVVENNVPLGMLDIQDFVKINLLG